MQSKILLVSLILCMVFPSVLNANELHESKERAGVTISAGARSSFAIQSDGSLWAWGENEFGQLGDGTTIERSSPVKVLDDVVKVSTGGSHTLAIRSDGSLWSWGAFGSRRNFVYDRQTRSVVPAEPAQILERVVSASTSGSFSMAIREDGSLWSWGSNFAGTLGDGTTNHRTRPRRIMEDVTAVSVGLTHTLAVRSDGSLWAWGWNRFGKLGDGTETERHTPVHIMDEVVAVSAGFFNSAAIKTDGSLWAWGANISGQLGNGTTVHSSLPVLVIEENVAAVSVGRHYVMAIDTDNNLWAWGGNCDGELGDGTTLRRSTPVKVMENVAAVSAGGSFTGPGVGGMTAHTLALGTDGTLWAWGNNRWGQLGNGITQERMWGQNFYFAEPQKIVEGVMLPDTLFS